MLAQSSCIPSTSCIVGASLATAASRGLTVLSWGRNVEGQCGVESSLLLLRPTPVLELHDAPLASIHAGKVNSAAVTSHGEAWTWGDGKGGKLGHGTAEQVHAPHRVESLVGRASVAALALGDCHSLFADCAGGLWACGENKEGQCGLGTPVEVIASQHRRAYYESFRALSNTLANEPRASAEQRGRQAIQSLMGGTGGQQQRAAVGAAGWGQQPQQHSSRGSGWQGLMSAGSSSSSSSSATSPASARSALHFAGLDFEGAFAAAGLQAGQQGTPLRIGRDQHPLLALGMERWGFAAQPALAAAAGGGGGWRGRAAGGAMDVGAMGAALQGEMRVVLPSGLEDQAVVALAASRYFSAALTAAGEVWTFGACYNGALGHDNSWSTSAQRVSGALSSAIADGGGATALAAGGTFCAALTASGRVVVWGRLPGGEGGGGGGGGEAEPLGGGEGGVLGVTEEGLGVVQGGRVVAGVVPGLPPITHIAAGQQHLLLSDGARVWLVGRPLDASGTSAGPSAPWRRPALVLTLPQDDAVRQLTAGAHSSGVVSEAGHAWVWGRLLDRHHAEGVLRRYPHALYGRTGAGGGGPEAPLLSEDVRWEWAGFGGRAPARVEGLEGRVQALALGGWHAVAIVD